MIYLVDYENVHSTGLQGIGKLTVKDQIIIFLKKENTFKANAHIELECSPAKKQYIYVSENTLNALDFKLATYLGILSAENPNEEFVIVSKDKGYGASINFLHDQGYHVKQHEQINKVLAEKKITKGKKKSEETKGITAVKLKKLLPGLTEKERKNIGNIINANKTKSQIHNNLVKALGPDKTGTVYKKIKPLL